MPAVLATTHAEPWFPSATPATAVPAAGSGEDPPILSAEEVEVAYLRHAPALLRYLYVRTGRVQDAEDLLTDTFIHARRYGKRIDHPGAFFYTVARRCANRYLERRDRETSMDPTDELGGWRGHDLSAEGAYLDHEHIDPAAPEIIALMALKAIYREILLLHGLDELPMREVAARLGINEDTAWQRWQRGRNRYFANLLAVGVHPSESWRRPRRDKDADGDTTHAADG